MEKITHNATATKKMGEKIGNYLRKEKVKHPLIALYGELGSGKTTFVQGLGRSLGLPDRIVSPTFIIAKKYSLKNLPWKNFYHVDLYRLNELVDLANLGFAEIFSDSRSIVVIEWAEKVESLLPKNAIKIYFKTLDMDRRKISIKNI